MRYQFVESRLFSKMVYDYFSEEDYTTFQHFFAVADLCQECSRLNPRRGGETNIGVAGP
jgi:hypothetical protein